jgi:succinate dehydrogenase hydrophobic anchor subunit
MKKSFRHLCGSCFFFALLACNQSYAADLPDVESIKTIALVAGLLLQIIVIHGIFGFWIAQDSRNHQMKHPALWIIAVILFGVPVLIGYMIVRTRGRSPRYP